MREALALAKQLVADGQPDQAREVLAVAITPETDFVVLARAARWAGTVAWPGLRPVKVAFLGGGTLDQLVDFTKFLLLLEGFQLEPYVAPFDTWKMEIVNPASALYAFRPEIVWLFTNYRDYNLNPRPEADWDEAVGQATGVVEEVCTWWQTVWNHLPGAQILQNNLDSPQERTFGHLEASLAGSRANLIRLVNQALARKAMTAGVKIFDLEYLASFFGLKNWHSPSYWFHSKHTFAPELAGQVAYQMAKTLAGALGGAKKVIVLDLDNTLWGGVIGDDGLEGIKLGNDADGEAFVAFQVYLKSLAERGIVLAVSSKNEEAAAKEPFLHHPEMRLTLDDLAVFKANWNNKADSIREIAAILNLGLDSFVFLDDNPAERALVRAELPMVAVPELPSDPVDYVPALNALAYFGSMSFSAEDRARGRMYRENAERAAARAQVTNLADYLVSLEMVGDSGGPDAFHLPRMAQLINKSNQFHPTTTRYTEAELSALAQRDDCWLRWFSLKDRFGDHGLIASLILKREGDALAVDTWAMSCRVLERGMEEFIIRELIALTASTGASKLIGRYIPTKKNGLVANLYEKLGFTPRPASNETLIKEWEFLVGGERSASPLFIR